MTDIDTADRGAEGRPRRRRSRHVSTLLVGAAALHLAACGDDGAQQTQARIFPTLEACSQEFPESECRGAFEASRQLHLQTAPRFDTQAACETQLGQGACQQVPVAAADGSVTNMFVPALMGFMLARALTPPPGVGGFYGFNYGGGYYQPRPIYVDRDGFLRTGRAEVGRIPGGRDALARSTTSTSVTVPTTRSGQIGKPTAQRGGFGRTSGRIGGGG